MARTVVAIYDNFQMANDAVRELVDSGFPRDNISVVANNEHGEFDATGEMANKVESDADADADAVANETGAGAGVGAGIGAAIGGIGGLLVGLGALTIPGVGPVIAAGPLAVALSTLTGAGVGAVAGGVTGGLLGALIGLGVPEEEAGYYTEGVRRGGVLVTVQADEYNADQITSILNRHDPVDINERASEWRSSGWTGYDPDARTVPAAGSPEGLQDHNVTDRGFTDHNRKDQSVMGQHDAMDSGLSDHNRKDQSVMGQRDAMDSGLSDRNRMDQGVMGKSDVTNRDFTDRNRMDQGVMGQGKDYYEGFDAEYSAYRTHYSTNLADSGQPYSFYVPAYRYGYGLRRDDRFQGRDWSMIESDARNDWERDHPGTWDRVKNAIRNAWEDLTD